MEKRTVLLSFLGKAKYGERRYIFPGEFSCDDTLPVAAVWTFLRDFRRKRITDFIIAGTAGSSWGNLKAWFNSSLKLGLPYEVQNCPDEITPEQLREEEDLLNREIGERCGVQFRLVLHERYSCSLDEQFSVVRGVRDLVPEGADLFIDVTTGLRVMPMAAHALALCLKETRDVSIQEVFYNRDSSNNNKRDTTGRTEQVNDWINRINGLAASEDTAFARQKLSALRELLHNVGVPKKAASGSQNTAAKKLQPNNVCILNPLSAYVRTADMVNRFMHSGDIGVFQDLKLAADFRSGIKEAGRIMKYCEYSEARMTLPREFESLVSSLDDPYLKFFMGYMTDWVSEENEPAFFRGMASMYASVENYIYAMMATYHAMDLELKAHGIDPRKSSKAKNNYLKKNYPYPEGMGGKKSKGKSKSKQKSKVTPYQDFMQVFRSALVHKDSSGIGMKSKDFYLDLEECLDALGVELRSAKADVPASRMMVSFLGAGDYTRTDYEYYDPASGKTDSRYSLSNSLFLGCSMARRLRDEEGLAKLLVVGSSSSSWNVFLKSFLEQFEFSDGVREELEKAQAILSTIEGEFSSNDLQTLGDILKTASDDIGMDVEMLVISSDIENQEEQQKLCRELNERTEFNASLYIDLTHSYRIMPALMFGVLAYMKSFKGITVEKIFYGDFPLISDAVNSTEGASGLIRDLNSLKRDPASYDLLKPEVDHLLADIAPVCSRSYVYDMKNLDLLIDYSMALGNYATTGKMSFLLPLINGEFHYNSDGDNRRELAEKFKSGMRLLGLSMFNDARSQLLPVYRELCSKIHDPVLELLESDIRNSLSWVEHSGNSNVAVLLSMGETMLRNGNDLESLLYAYQGLQDLDTIIYNSVKKVYLQEKCQSSAVFSEINAFLKNRDMQIGAKHKDSTFYEELCKGKHLINIWTEVKYTNFCSAINYFIFGENWNSIKNSRNNVVHGEKLRKKDIKKAQQAIMKVVTFLKNQIPAIESMTPENVCQTLSSLKESYAGWKNDAGEAPDKEQKPDEGDACPETGEPQA
ncbi:CRISPR-associated DxTHG motif protein [Succinimonas sp.]|uniref:CRISPR-associated DxTHG motif protein n=1 Tax=Succinimonas sp. TaxID=1936151 RepID=UPI00386A62F8